MKRLLLALLLISSASFADWGDVYYCQMTSNVDIRPDGRLTQLAPEKFQFKLDKEKDAMVFGSSSYFVDILAGLTKDRAWPDKEYWSAVALNSSYAFREGEFQSINTSHSDFYFKEGKFLYSRMSISGVTSVTADCDKF